MPQCLILNCPNNAENNISIRCRRTNTSAIWAPNTEAFLCDIHADQGYSIDITFTPVRTQQMFQQVDILKQEQHQLFTTLI